VQELEELDAFAQPPLHHVRIAQHPAEQREHLPRPEIELPIEFVERVEDQRGADAGIL